MNCGLLFPRLDMCRNQDLVSVAGINPNEAVQVSTNQGAPNRDILVARAAL